MFLWEYALSSPHPQVVAWPTGKRYFPRAWRERKKQRSLREAATGNLWKRKFVFQGKLSIVLLSLYGLSLVGIDRLHLLTPLEHFHVSHFCLCHCNPQDASRVCESGARSVMIVPSSMELQYFSRPANKTGAHIKRLYHRVLDFVPDWTVEMSEVFLLTRNVQANWCTQKFSKHDWETCALIFVSQMSS